MKKLTEIAFFVDDVAQMAAFYSQFLSTEPAARSEGMAIFMLDGVKLFIHRTYTPEEGELPPENHFAYTVPDVDAACQEMQAQGYQVEAAPKEYYWGYSAYLRDPAGHLLELIQEEAPNVE